MMRGLKKSVFRLIWVFAFAILCLLASKAIANAIVAMDFSFLHISYNGEQITTLPILIEKMLESSNPDMASLIADNPEIMQMCIAIATSMATLVMFELLFWVTKILFWPIWAILAATLFKNKKKVKTEGVERVVKQKKHAGFGALVGLGVGALVCLFTFVPITFVNSTLMQLEEQTTVEYEEGTQQGVLSQFLGENKEWVMVYENSTLNKVFRYTGLELVQNGLGDLLTTTNVAGKRISAKGEISNLTPIYVDYTKIIKYDFNNLSRGDINEILKLADDAQGRVLSSNLIETVYDKLGPYIVKNMLENENYFIKLPHLSNEQLDDIVRNALKAFFGYDNDMNFDAEKLVSMKDIKNDISIIIDIAKKLNNEDLVLKIKNNQLTFEVLKEKVTVELSNSIIDDVFELKTLATLLPVVVEPGIKFAVEALPAVNFEGTPIKPEYTALEGGIKIANLKELSKNLAESAINVLKGFDRDLQLYISSDKFDDVGKALDQLKTEKLISLATYNSLLNYSEAYIKNALDGAGLDEHIKSIANDMIDSINGIGRFETEFGKFGNAYQTYLDNNKELSAETITKMLDDIKSTYLYTNNIDSVISHGTSFVISYIQDNNLPLETTGIDTVVNSITNIESFQTEYNNIKSLIDFVKAVGAENISTDENLVTLGEELDKCIQKHSVLLSNANIKTIVKDFIGKFDLPDDIKNITIGTKSIKEVIKENIDNGSSYKAEMQAIVEVKSISNLNAENNNDLITIGEILDKNIVKNSALFGNLIPSIAKEFIDIIELPDDIKDMTVGSKTLKETLKDNVDNITSYKAEMQAVAEVKSIANLDADDSDDLISIGEILDKDIVKNSALFGNLIPSIAKEFIDIIELPDDIKNITVGTKTIKEAIKDNVASVVSYETEMQMVAQMKGIQNITTTGKQKLVDIGEILDNVKPSKLFGNIISSIVIQYFDDELANYTIDAQILPIIQDIKNNVSNDLVYKTEFGYMYDFMSADFDSISNFKTYLGNNLLDADGESKSGLITTDNIYDIVIEMADNIEIAEVDIIDEIKAKLAADKEDNENILDVLTQLENISTEFDDLKTIPSATLLNREYLTGIGARIDYLTTDYNLIINNGARTKIGDYIAEQIYLKVNSDTLIPQGRKDAIETTYQNKADYATYEALFDQYADDLQLP
ncbi:MAG: hypothetical protein IKR12_02110 [Clostridia bacterium]|nr:hypothetical protein [Clostridia bacterium]